MIDGSVHFDDEAVPEDIIKTMCSIIETERSEQRDQFQSLGKTYDISRLGSSPSFLCRNRGSRQNG